MSQPVPEPAAPFLAASLLVLRDGPAGIEVLMMERPQAAGFAAGAMVFPGGRIEAADRALCPCCPPSEDRSDDALILRIAAIRETFEECGLLLARQGDAILSAAALAALRDGDLTQGGFARLVETAKLGLATDALVPYAHWITPADRRKRFDTHFFLAPAPPDQLVAHDGNEAVEAVWTTPQAALRAAAEKRYKLVFVTHMNLLKLSRHKTVAEALAAARREAIVTVCPEWVTTSAGEVIRIPEAAGYGGGEFSAVGMGRA